MYEDQYHEIYFNDYSTCNMNNIALIASYYDMIIAADKHIICLMFDSICDDLERLNGQFSEAEFMKLVAVLGNCRDIKNIRANRKLTKMFLKLSRSNKFINSLSVTQYKHFSLRPKL